MTTYLSAVPAYGRDYKSKKEVLADWRAGKDFLVQDLVHSGYININDKPSDVTLQIRYKRLTMVCVVK
jgi:hypothetical protein